MQPKAGIQVIEVKPADMVWYCDGGSQFLVPIEMLDEFEIYFVWK